MTLNSPDGAPSAGAGEYAASPSGGQPGDVVLRGVVDLLGVLSYALLVAFFRLVEDAALAESLADKAALGEMAVAEFGHFRLVRDRLRELDVDPDEAMRPFVAPLDEFHARTAPSDWLEGLVKAYVGDGIAVDFCRAVVDLLDEKGNVVQSTRSTEQGNYRFKNVDQGRYTVRARKEGFKDLSASVTSAPASAPAKADLAW